jgi:LuxR family maltose regulon positive regulatory protein
LRSVQTDAAMAPEPSNSLLSGEQLARTLLFAKLAPPVLRSDVVGRERLFGLLERALLAKLLLIHAPAGYGKTTLMVQRFKQLKEAGEGVGWINLDERDNDPVTLLASLQLALLPGSEQEALDALHVINRCAANHQRFTLFLDELEAVHAPQSMQLLELLLDYSPGNLHVMIGTRTTPALPLARLRIRHELFELNSQHLRFLRTEAAQLLYVRCGAELNGTVLDDLLEKTEGWAAALQLAAASLARGADQEHVMEHLSGSRTQVIEYLAVDVVGKLPHALRAFLLATAGLRRLCVSLCDAVTGRGDSATMLRKLEDANLFLQPLDETREWYRYHALFAEFLQLQLRQSAPEREAGLARKASDWCGGNGLMVEAVEYSLQAHDIDHAIAQMERCIDHQIRMGQFRTIRRWLSALPQQLIDNHPHLVTANAWALTFCQDFRLAAKVIEQLRRVSEDPRNPVAYRETLMVLEPVLLGVMGRRQESMERALAAWAQIERSSPLVRGSLGNSLAYSCIALGRHEDAQRYLREASFCLTGPPANVSGLAYNAGIAGIHQACLGNLAGAIHLFRSIEKLVANYSTGLFSGIELRFLPAIGIGCCAELLYESNDIDEAEECLDRYFRFVDSVLMLESTILVHLIKIRIHLSRGEITQAEDVLLAASQHAIRTGIAWLAPIMDWERVRIALVNEDLDRAQIQARSIEPCGAADVAPTFIHPYEEINGAGIETIRLYIYQGEVERALECLQVQIQHASVALRRRRLVKLYILQAMALASGQRDDAALEVMLGAVRLGMTMRAVRCFVDEGQRCLVLLKALADGRTLPLDGNVTMHLQMLIDAFQSGNPSEAPALTLAAKQLVESISARELQILERLAQGYSNLAVAQQLSLSPNTVKWHLRHIYDKLGAKNRNEAVFLARQRGLLA